MTPKTKFLLYTTEDTNMKYNFNVLIKEVEPDGIGQDVLWWQSAFMLGSILWVSSAVCPLSQPSQQLTITTVS